MKTYLSIITLAILFAFTPLKSKKYTLDTTQSILVWTGKKVTGEHKGNVPLSKGEINIDSKNNITGSIELNMNLLTVTDIVDKDKNQKLVDHLKNADFFSTDKFPKANFVITSSKNNGGDNYGITGNLTIKGITKSISFPAKIVVAGKKLNATGTITINRTLFDIKFKSSSFFENLGDKAIYDDFTIDFNLKSK